LIATPTLRRGLADGRAVLDILRESAAEGNRAISAIIDGCGPRAVEVTVHEAKLYLTCRSRLCRRRRPDRMHARPAPDDAADAERVNGAAGLRRKSRSARRRLRTASAAVSGQGYDPAPGVPD